MKRYCVLLLFFLVGCQDEPEHQAIINLLRQDSANTCVLVTLNKHFNLYFNTLKRTYDANTGSMKNAGPVDTISVDYDDDLRYARQMELLVDQGLFMRTSHYINKGNFNLSGYYTQPIQFKAHNGTIIETTLDRPGGQYRLTEKGKQYIKNDNNTNELSLCIGYLIPYHINVVKERENLFVVFYQLKLDERPDWLTPEMIKAFPSIETEMIRLNEGRTVYRQYVSKNAQGELILP